MSEQLIVASSDRGQSAGSVSCRVSSIDSLIIEYEFIKFVVSQSKAPALAGKTWNDYNNVYPEDEYMEEMRDDARVWRVYNDESDRIDAELVLGWIGTLDTLLLFAGLFSAVIATFVTQTTQFLQQDYTVVTASLLTEMVSIQRATAIGANISDIPTSALNFNSSFTSTSRDIWLNGLWLASLGLTLSTALMAGLVKQWLHYYLADVTGSPKDRACTRQFRYLGLTRWGVPPIIELLPVLMNTSLLLFFVGLILYTQDLTGLVGITWFLVALTAISFVIYVGSSVLPVLKPQCPYKTSLSKLCNGFVRLFWVLSVRLFVEKEYREDERKLMDNENLHWLAVLLVRGSSMKIAESRAVAKQKVDLQLSVITEMATRSTNPSVSSIALQSLAALHSMDSVIVPASNPLGWRLQTAFETSFRQVYAYGEWKHVTNTPTSTVERYSRAMLWFSEYMQFRDWERLACFTSPPESLHVAALLASIIKHAGTIFEDKHRLFVEHILEHPTLDVSQVHPWQFSQFQDAIRAIPVMDILSANDQKRMLLTLIKGLSLDRSLSLREELLIRCLHVCYKGVSGSKEMNVVSTEKSNEISYPVITDVTLQLIELLPTITDYALSLGAEKLDRLIHFVGKMTSLRNENHIIYERFELLLWNGQILNIRKRDSLIIFHRYMEGLNDLLHRLLASWEDASAWKGNVSLRLDAIMNLCIILRLHIGCDEQVIQGMFHWLLVISVEHHPGFVRMNKLFEEKLLDFLFCWAEDKRFSLLVDFIKSKKLVGLPPNIRNRLVQWLDYEVRVQGNSSFASEKLDDLFRHFLHRDPLEADQGYSLGHQDQHQTLSSLIDFVCEQQAKSERDSWERILASWHTLIEEKLSANTESEKHRFNFSADMRVDGCDVQISEGISLKNVQGEVHEGTWPFDDSPRKNDRDAKERSRDRTPLEILTDFRELSRHLEHVSGIGFDKLNKPSILGVTNEDSRI